MKIFFVLAMFVLSWPCYSKDQYMFVTTHIGEGLGIQMISADIDRVLNLAQDPLRGYTMIGRRNYLKSSNFFVTGGIVGSIIGTREIGLYGALGWERRFLKWTTLSAQFHTTSTNRGVHHSTILIGAGIVCWQSAIF